MPVLEGLLFLDMQRRSVYNAPKITPEPERLTKTHGGPLVPTWFHSGALKILKSVHLRSCAPGVAGVCPRPSPYLIIYNFN